MKTVERFLREEDGQGLAEYSLILALVAMTVLGALQIFGQAINFSLHDSTNKITS